jgi:hypothetical protein
MKFKNPQSHEIDCADACVKSAPYDQWPPSNLLLTGNKPRFFQCIPNFSNTTTHFSRIQKTTILRQSKGIWRKFWIFLFFKNQKFQKQKYTLTL